MSQIAKLGAKAIAKDMCDCPTVTRKRIQLTIGEVIDHLQKCNRNLPMYAAVSLINLDEPIETQEFIDDCEKKRCVAVEFCNEYATIGWAEEENG